MHYLFLLSIIYRTHSQRLTIRLVCTCFLAVLQAPRALSQISDALYESLEQAHRPVSRRILTPAEKRKIIRFAFEDDWPPKPVIEREVDSLARQLEQETQRTGIIPDKVLNNVALGDYYQFFKDRENSSGRWVPYYEQVLHWAAGHPEFDSKVAHAYAGIAIYRVQQSKYEEASELLNRALIIFNRLKDTSGISLVHAYYYPLYSSLNLYAQAIREQNLALRYITASERQHGMDVYYANENYQDKALTYLCWYEAEKHPAHLDSADSYMNRTPLTGNDARRWQAFHYFLVGYRAFLAGDFKKALTNIDASLLEKEYYSEMNMSKLIYKGISLLKLGKRKEAKQILLDPGLPAPEYYLREIAYRALCQDARQQGDFESAFNYYELSNRYKDSSALITQRGKVFEAMQKYSVIEKEMKIKDLELVNTKKEQQGNMLALVFAVVGLALLAVIIGLYTINRARKLRTLETESLLEKERRNKEDILRLQERDLQRTRRKAIANLRKKISRDLHDELTSALAGLRYYVNDLRLKETDDDKKELLKNIELEVESVYKQARTYMHNLNQGIEEAVGSLTPFLQHISQDLAQKSGIDIRLKYDKAEIESKLSPNQQQQLTLMLKEATSNILKHADATVIEVTIGFNQGRCNFSISDNGRGIGKNLAEKGLGMESMGLRIRRIKGRTTMRSSPAGTTLEGYFPLGQS